MTLKRAGDLIGLPVVSILTGEDIAEVRDVMYDVAVHRLIGFTLNGRGALARPLERALPVERIVAIGSAAVMVSDERVLAGEGESQGELAGEREVAPVVGIPVLSADGRALGQVLDVIIETGGDPHAVGYEITERTRGGTAFVPLAAQVALSGDNLLLSSDAEQWMGDDLASVRMASDAFPPPDPGDRR